ncbi:MAG TPA: basic amino acid ABC transporter substrate-binding protein [Clostridia bacterium]|nr:basic amino acid ABC transporter substrate-binding protein [Clostridia bacterium]
MSREPKAERYAACRRKKGVRLAAISIILVALFVTMAVAGCSQKPAAEKSALEEIKEKGVLVVGTSADYPPFEYTDEKGEYVGFDMDLIRAIGEKLGVKVEIQDMSFESLTQAVKDGKIDAAIACMSATPDRLKEVDFTKPYYITKDAVLVRKDSTLNIGKLEDIYNLKIGVQTGTTQEDWVNEHIQSGEIKEANVSRYPRMDQAVLDLASGRIDVALMDLPPAQKFVEAKPVRIALEAKMSEGDPGIAVKKGAKDLVDELNRIIDQLTEEKVIEQLVQKHLSATE